MAGERLAREPSIPHTAQYVIEVRELQDRGYVGSIHLSKSTPWHQVEKQPNPWSSRGFRTSAAAWRAVLRELMRRQGLT